MSRQKCDLLWVEFYEFIVAFMSGLLWVYCGICEWNLPCGIFIVVSIRVEFLLWHSQMEFTMWNFYCGIHEWNLLCGIFIVASYEWNFYCGMREWNLLCGIFIVALCEWNFYCGITWNLLDWHYMENKINNASEGEFPSLCWYWYKAKQKLKKNKSLLVYLLKDDTWW